MRESSRRFSGHCGFRIFDPVAHIPDTPGPFLACFIPPKPCKVLAAETHADYQMWKLPLTWTMPSM